MANENGESDPTDPPAVSEALPEAPPADAATAVTESKPPGPGPKLHLVRGLLITVLGALTPFLIMTAVRRFGFSIPVGFAGCLIAALGILDLIGSFDDAPDRVAVK